MATKEERHVSAFNLAVCTQLRWLPSLRAIECLSLSNTNSQRSSSLCVLAVLPTATVSVSPQRPSASRHGTSTSASALTLHHPGMRTQTLSLAASTVLSLAVASSALLSEAGPVMVSAASARFSSLHLLPSSPVPCRLVLATWPCFSLVVSSVALLRVS